MKNCFILLLTAVVGGLLPACRDSVDPARFASLRGTVESLVRTEVELLEMEKSRIEHDASKSGNQPGHAAVVQKANGLYNVAQGLLSRLDTLQKHFIAGKGRDAVSSAPPDYRHRFRPGRTCRKELDLLERELRRLVAAVGPGGAVGAGDLFEDLLSRLKDGEISLAAALAGVWELKLETTRFALTNLQALRRELTGPDEMGPYLAVDAPAVLPEGDSLRMKVALRGIILQPGEGQPLMTWNGEPVAVRNGIGKVRFIAQGPPGKKHWEAAIRVKIFGQDTVFRATQTYWVLAQ